MYNRDNIFYNIFGQIEINSIIEHEENLFREEFIKINKNANICKNTLKRRIESE